MKKILIVILLCSVTIFVNSQDFLSKYPKLTKTNMIEFFIDWKAYSDSVNTSNVISDSVLAEVIKWEYAAFWLEGSTTGQFPKYNTLPRFINVERYYLDVDTAMAKLCHGFPEFIPDLKVNQYFVDSITPVLPHNGLYLTPDLEKTLSIFVGGIRFGDKKYKIKKGNVNRLKKYVTVDYGHWGGYWWFTSFPLITNICYADNLIVIMRRTSWCTGDVIWYIKENDKFVRYPEPITYWIE